MKLIGYTDQVGGAVKYRENQVGHTTLTCFALKLTGFCQKAIEAGRL
jgi:hypothetical protein